MNEHEVAAALKDLLDEVHFMDEQDMVQAGLPESIRDFAGACTFESAGVMTNNAGIVIALSDGTEFQVTVVQSA